MASLVSDKRPRLALLFGLVRGYPRRLGVAWTIALATAGGSCVVDARPTDGRLACAEGRCECQAGWADCDSNPETGCEADLGSALDHCGGCHQRCRNGQCLGGSCQCDADHADCDGQPATSCETDVRSDPHHCGRCDHDCEGGDCLEGICQAAVLRDDLFWPWSLSLSADHAFWTNYDGLWAYRLDGSAPPQRLTVQANRYIATDTDRVYWLGHDGSLWSRTMDGPSIQLAQSPAVEDMAAIAVTPDSVFWSWVSIEDACQSQLYRVARQGGDAALVPGVHPTKLAVDGTHLYFFDCQSRLHRMPLPEGDIEPLCQGAPILHELVVGPDGPYWSASHGIFLCRDSTQVSARLSTDALDYGALASDASCVYFTCDGSPLAGLVGHIPTPWEGELRTLATGQFGPFGIALSDRFVYWVTITQLLRLVRQ